MNDLLIRTARTGDAAALVALLDELGYPGTGACIEDRLAQLLSHEDALLLVAEASGVVLGVISAHFIPQLALAGDFCRISYLCVAPRARSLGLGARLESAVAEAARLRGCDRIELHSDSRRIDAHRFYERLGYAESPKYLVKAPRPSCPPRGASEPPRPVGTSARPRTR